MSATTCSMEKFIEFGDEFRLQLEFAGEEFAPPMIEKVKHFINGLQPPQLQQENWMRQSKEERR